MSFGTKNSHGFNACNWIFSSGLHSGALFLNSKSIYVWTSPLNLSEAFKWITKVSLKSLGTLPLKIHSSSFHFNQLCVIVGLKADSFSYLLLLLSGFSINVRFKWCPSLS